AGAPGKGVSIAKLYGSPRSPILGAGDLKMIDRCKLLVGYVCLSFWFPRPARRVPDVHDLDHVLANPIENFITIPKYYVDASVGSDAYGCSHTNRTAPAIAWSTLRAPLGLRFSMYSRISSRSPSARGVNRSLMQRRGVSRTIPSLRRTRILRGLPAPIPHAPPRAPHRS